MNNKKLLVALAGALAVAATTYARPAPGHNDHGRRGPAPVHHVERLAGHHHVAHHRTPPPPPPPRHHHHHKHHTSGLDIAAGIVQTIADIFAPPPAPVVVTQPTVVATPTVVTTPTVITTPTVYQTW